MPISFHRLNGSWNNSDFHKFSDIQRTKETYPSFFNKCRRLLFGSRSEFVMHQNKSYFQIEKHLSLVLYSQKHFISKQQVKAFCRICGKNTTLSLIFSKDLLFGYSHERVWRKYILDRFSGKLQKILNLLIKLTVSPEKMKIKKQSCLHICTLNNAWYFLLFLIVHQRMNLQKSLFCNGCCVVWISEVRQGFFWWELQKEGCVSQRSQNKIKV